MKKPVRIDADKDAQRYAALNAVFADAPKIPDNETTKPLNETFMQFLNFLAIRDNKGWSLHRLPWSATKVAWLNDGDHLLVKSSDEIGVYEISTHSYAPVLVEKGIGQKTIRYRNERDQQL